jgi:hypothetical protein
LAKNTKKLQALWLYKKLAKAKVRERALFYYKDKLLIELEELEKGLGSSKPRKNSKKVIKSIDATIPPRPLLSKLFTANLGWL